MEPTYEELKARHLQETGAEGMALSVTMILGGLVLCAVVGLGFGLLVMGICTAIDGYRIHRRGSQMATHLGQAPKRLAGHADPWGDGMYPPQAYTPTNRERARLDDPPSGLGRFGNSFFKWWTILWVVLAILVLLSNI